MFVIASNITSREAAVERLFRQLRKNSWATGDEPLKMLQGLAQRCVAAGADALEVNLQQHDDRPEIMTAVIQTVQEVTDRQICLSTNSPAALEAGLKACRHFPIVNYIALDEDRLKEMLPLAARHGAEVVLLASDPSHPADAQEMMGRSAILVGAANEVGIPNDHLFVDPGLIHITHDIGQRHFVEVKEFLRALPDTFDPLVRSTCWLSNVSVDAPRRLRPIIESIALAELAALGLSSAFMDVLSLENKRTVRLLKVLDNEVIYSDSEIVVK